VSDILLLTVTPVLYNYSVSHVILQ